MYKMTSSRRCNAEVQPEDEEESFLQQVTRVVHNPRIKTQPMMDVIIAIISIPLLIIFSFMLQRHMRSDWLNNVETRWRILGLGLSLLFISLVVCLYVTHRLGLCIWAAQQQRDSRQNPEMCSRVTPVQNHGSALTAGGHLHLVGGGELPPSYDSIIRNSDFPPPSYISLLVNNEKTKNLQMANDNLQDIQRFETVVDARINAMSLRIPGAY